jgi:hypothetical protein
MRERDREREREKERERERDRETEKEAHWVGKGPSWRCGEACQVAPALSLNAAYTHSPASQLNQLISNEPRDHNLASTDDPFQRFELADPPVKAWYGPGQEFLQILRIPAPRWARV